MAKLAALHEDRLVSSASQSCCSTFPLGWQWRVLWSSLLHCVRLGPSKSSQGSRGHGKVLARSVHMASSQVSHQLCTPSGRSEAVHDSLSPAEKLVLPSLRVKAAQATWWKMLSLPVLYLGYLSRFIDPPSLLNVGNSCIHLKKRLLWPLLPSYSPLWKPKGCEGSLCSGNRYCYCRKNLIHMNAHSLKVKFVWTTPPEDSCLLQGK